MRDAALARVWFHGEDYISAALYHIRDLRGREMTGEDVRLHVESLIGAPHHHNTWGAIINVCVRRGLLNKTGKTTQMRTLKSHARTTPIYEVR